jgi:predicted phosphodiesterase
MISYERSLFVSDIHAPYQDDKAISAMLNFARWFEPHTIFIMGDLVDFYAISKFIKDPYRALELQAEIDVSIAILQNIRNTCKKARIYLLRGNHEYRLQKYLWTNAKELAGLKALDLRELLKLKSLDIEYLENGRINHHGLLLKHGSIVRKFSAYTAKAEFEKNGCSGVSVHCFDKKTELLTKRGWVNGLDLLPDDVAGTMNKKTREFEWNKINKIYQYDGYKELYRIRGQSIDLLVTDKHGLIYENDSGKQKEIEARKNARSKRKTNFLQFN